MSGVETRDAPNPVVQRVYDRLGDLLADGDDRFVEEGPALLQDAMEEDGFFDGVGTERADYGEYTRKKVVGGGGDGSHVVRFMEWPPEYALLPHEHHGRPCFEVLVDGRLVLTDMEAERVGDGEYLLHARETHTTEPGEAAVVDPRDGEIHAVYSPVRSRSLHVYPDDSHESVGYVPKEDDDSDRDVYERRTFRLRDTE